jgi:hypothetical protein
MRDSVDRAAKRASHGRPSRRSSESPAKRLTNDSANRSRHANHTKPKTNLIISLT